MQRKDGFRPHTIIKPHRATASLLILVLLTLYFILSACNVDTVPVVPVTPSPTATQIVQPQQAPICPATVTPSLTETPQVLPLTPVEEAVALVERYVDRVLGHFFWRAYNLLRVDLRAREPYKQFIKDANFTLSSGCWQKGQLYASQIDGQTWNVWLSMLQSPAGSADTISYTWHFHVSLTDGPPEITAIGLYPTGIDPH